MKLHKLVASVAMAIVLVLAFALLISPARSFGSNDALHGLPMKATGLAVLPLLENAPGSIVFSDPEPGAGNTNNNKHGRPQDPPKNPHGESFGEVAHMQSSPDASKYHQLEGPNATTLYKGPTVNGYHDSTPGPDFSKRIGAVHVEEGPEATRIVYSDFQHADEPGPDFTRYFPPGWHHNTIPGMMQSLWVGPGWEHWELTSYMGPPGNGDHIAEGPDATNHLPPGNDPEPPPLHVSSQEMANLFNKSISTMLPVMPGWSHIEFSPAVGQESMWKPPTGPGSATHVSAGADESLWVPNGHIAAGPNASLWAPGGWVHIPSGSRASQFHPPGWVHASVTGPDKSKYFPGDYAHATQSPPSGASDPLNGGPEDFHTVYLPPGWTHISNADFPDYTSYYPPGFVHASEYGGTWPNNAVGTSHASRIRTTWSEFIPPTLTHINMSGSPDVTLYAPTTGNGHVSLPPNNSHYIPNDWVHVVQAGVTEGGQPLSSSSYIEPGWTHQTSNEAVHGPSTYALNP